MNAQNNQIEEAFPTSSLDNDNEHANTEKLNKGENSMNVSNIVMDREHRLLRALNSLRAVSALAFSEYSPGEALMGKRGDLSDLLEILSDELEISVTPIRN